MFHWMVNGVKLKPVVFILISINEYGPSFNLCEVLYEARACGLYVGLNNSNYNILMTGYISDIQLNKFASRDKPEYETLDWYCLIHVN